MPARVRVAAYVTRTRPAGPELLVFDHRDHPGAGTQIPAGGVSPDEPLTQAAGHLADGQGEFIALMDAGERPAAESVGQGGGTRSDSGA
ncbi:hypothetical protein H9Y04_04885 [Streptomyces sp. TRM66268-LWL]|uniref:Uncharacterized protein n=1 Tax=Streptomyces polyasparticus TaxID=2767826 RepID=A0ABR7S8W3_9ACTN|nr:hypothetical protein [Streptomyces polyasparticus]MBC9711905.1 hypothetical protein [Streptomyces polyasparticus]